MSGKMNNKLTFKELYDRQVEFQRSIVKDIDIPTDSVEWFKYHMLAMMEEMGEVLTSDKRWKTHRHRYDVVEKLDELADVFITLTNILIYSNVSPELIMQTVSEKIDKNIERVAEEYRRSDEC